MTKTIVALLALIAATPALAHPAPMHPVPHGAEGLAGALLVILVAAALTWRRGKS